MARIFISPSTQEHNAYTGGSTEETQMRAICLMAAGILRTSGHTVTVGGSASAAANVAEANAHDYDWYLAVHSDAGGGDGTTVFHYPGSRAGIELATALYSTVAPLSPGADNGVRSRADLIETHGPKAPAALIEVAFHDNKVEAQHIRTHHADYARAIARGILRVAPSAPKPHTEAPVVPGFWLVFGVHRTAADATLFATWAKAHGIAAKASGRAVVAHGNDLKSRAAEKELEAFGGTCPFGRIPTTQESYKSMAARTELL